MSPSVHVIDMVTNEKYYTQFQNAENNYVLISLYSVSYTARVRSWRLIHYNVLPPRTFEPPRARAATLTRKKGICS